MEGAGKQRPHGICVHPSVLDEPDEQTHQEYAPCFLKTVGRKSMSCLDTVDKIVEQMWGDLFLAAIKIVQDDAGISALKQRACRFDE